MAASTSKAFLGDIHHVDDIITSCSSALDVAKHTGVYFKDRTPKRCLRASVDIRRSEPLCGTLSLRHSVFSANWRKQNSIFLHGPRLKNLSVTSPACLSAGAAQEVFYDGSARDEQPPNSSLSPEQYVILILPFFLKTEFVVTIIVNYSSDNHEEPNVLCVSDHLIGWLPR